MSDIKIYEHDVESYVITIRRKGAVAAAPVVVAPVAQVQKTEPVVKKTIAAEKTISAPLPGVIIEVKVKAGDVIKAGQVVAVLEAMKMENDIPAPCDGVIASVNVQKGASVAANDVIATLN